MVFLNVFSIMMILVFLFMPNSFTVLNKYCLSTKVIHFLKIQKGNCGVSLFNPVNLIMIFMYKIFSEQDFPFLKPPWYSPIKYNLLVFYSVLQHFSLEATGNKEIPL